MAEPTRETAGAAFESWVRKAFKTIGFRVDGGAHFRIGGHQVDCCAGWDDVLLVVECTQSETQSASLRPRISELRGKLTSLRSGFKRTRGYEVYSRFVFAIATNITPTEGESKLANQHPRIHLIDKQMLSYYERLAAVIRRSALFNLLGELGVVPRDLEFPRLPAFKITFEKYGPAYLFWCDPAELLKIAYVARRESGRTLYYQRLLTVERLRNVRRYIDKGGVFPNNIIMAFADAKPAFRQKTAYEEGFPDWVTFGELQFPKSYRSAWVIDGQHRLYAFGLGDPNPKQQKLAVLAFERLDLSNQAKFFIDINREQRPVDKDLILDLEGDLRPETAEGKMANTVKQMNMMEPLKDSVYLPLSGKRQRGQLKLSGLVIDLKETGLLDERTHNMPAHVRNPLAIGGDLERGPSKAARHISEFLMSIREAADGAVWKSIVTTPGGMTLTLYAFESVLVHSKGLPSEASRGRYADAFVKAIAQLVSDAGGVRDFVRSLTSYAQRRDSSQRVLILMRQELKDESFAPHARRTDPFSERLIRFERAFARLVAEKLGIASINELKRWIPDNTLSKVTDRARGQPGLAVHEILTLGEVFQIVQRRDASAVIDAILQEGRELTTRDDVIAGLTQVVRARNDTIHGRPVANRDLAQAYLPTFERACH